MVTNPEDTSLGDDKDIIRAAVMGWEHSVKVYSGRDQTPLNLEFAFILHNK